MAKGQMQLAMEETEKRKVRDEDAIRWLIENLTEDAEMERFMMAIPGSFNTDWGVEVWKKIGNTEGGEGEDGGQNEPVGGSLADTTAPTTPTTQVPPGSVLTPIFHLVKKLTPHHPPSNGTETQPVPHSPNDNPGPHSATTQNEGDGIVYELSTRVSRSLEDCKNSGLFAKDEWRRRTRACIETTASLVFCANAKVSWFGDIEKLLGDIGASEKPRDLSLAGTDQFFVMHWTCLSLKAIRQFLSGNRDVRYFMDNAVSSFTGEDDDDDDDNGTLMGAKKIDETLHEARECLYKLYNALPKTEYLTEEGKKVIRDHASEISVLKKINTEADQLENVDHWIFVTQSSIVPNITFQIPGVRDDLDSTSVRLSHIVELSRDPRTIQFIRPRQALKSMCSLVPTLHAMLEGKGDADAYKAMRKSLGDLHFTMLRWQENEIQRQLWRLQDLRHGHGFGFTVELFFLALSQLLSTSSSKDSHSALYTGAFRAITFDWRKHKDTPGTQRLLLDIALSLGFELPDKYPNYIVKEFLRLLGNIFEGQKGSHIDGAIDHLTSLPVSDPESFQTRLLDILDPQARTRSSS